MEQEYEWLSAYEVKIKRTFDRLVEKGKSPELFTRTVNNDLLHGVRCVMTDGFAEKVSSFFIGRDFE